MATYRYRALTPTGKIRRGSTEARNRNDLEHLLASSQLELVSARDIGKSWLSRRTSRSAERRQKPHLISVCVQFSLMLRAGVPILDVIQHIAESAPSRPMKDIFSALKKDISEGNTLSGAMRRYPGLFDEVFISVIQTGEETGNLAQAFVHLEAHLRWLSSLQRHAAQGLRYPLFLMLFAIIIVLAYLLGLVPQFEEFLRSSKNLPLSTELLLWLSNQLRSVGDIVGLTVAAGLGLLLVFWTLSDGVKLAVARASFRVPFFGRILSDIDLARLSSILALCMENKLSLLKSLNLSASSVRNRALKNRLQRVIARINTGKRISQAFATESVFPPLIRRILIAGEESEDLGPAFTEMQNYYDYTVRYNVERLVGILRPALLFFVAGILVWIILSTLVPFYDNVQGAL